MTQETKNALLLGSILLNIVMIGVFVWFVKYSRDTMLQLVSDATKHNIEVQERVLAELSSGDAARISALTNSMHWDIEAQKRLRYRVDTGKY